MGIYSEAIQRLYVAYFNRPADPAGLIYWEQAIASANGSTAQASAAFAASDEYKSAYAGMDAAHVVNQVYLNLFGHSADAAGLDYWVQALANKQMTLSDAVTQIAGGALGSDKVAFQSKTAAASAFTSSLNTASLALIYTGERANLIAKNFLSTIVDDATLQSGITPEHLKQVIDEMSGMPPLPLVFNFTPGADKLVGTAGNDVFNAFAFDPLTGTPAITFGVSDSVDGGAGNDTLNLYIAAGRNSSPGSIKNVETVNVYADVGTAFDLSTMPGVTTFRQVGQAGTVFELGAATVATFREVGGALDVRAAGSSAGVALEQVGDSASLAVSGASLDSVTVSGSRVHQGPGPVAPMRLTVTAGADVDTLTVNTDQASTLTIKESDASAKHVTSLNAFRSTGDIVFDATHTPDITSITTGSGNDLITVAKVSGAKLTIQAGAGNDKVFLTGAPEAGDLIDGGAGSNTLVLFGVDASEAAAIAKLVTNFSSIQFVYPTTSGAVDASLLSSSYGVIDMGNGGRVTNVTTQSLIANGDLTATAAGYTAGKSYGGSLQVTEKADGTITAKAASIDLTVAASSTGVSATLSGDVQSASVNLTSDAGHTASVAIDTGPGLAAMNSLAVSGSGTATVTNADGSKLATINASGLGGVFTYNTSNKIAETIRLGAGIDHLTIGGSTLGSMDSVYGLKLQLDKSGTSLAAGSDTLSVVGVAATVKLFTTSHTDMDLALKDAAASALGDDLVFLFNGDAYVYHDNGNNLIDGGDTLVKLVGVTDTRAVIIALGGNPG